MKNSKPQGEHGSSLLAGEERRRSQRVIIRIPVTLEMTVLGQKVMVSAHTVAVNTHGAMLLCPRSINSDVKLEMVNNRSRERIDARVTRTPRDTSEGYLIPVGFDKPSTSFWQISFPPENWKPSDS